MTFLGHTKCRNDVIHQCCGLQDFKIVENYNILPGKICNTPKIFFHMCMICVWYVCGYVCDMCMICGWYVCDMCVISPHTHFRQSHVISTHAVLTLSSGGLFFVDFVRRDMRSLKRPKFKNTKHKSYRVTRVGNQIQIRQNIFRTWKIIFSVLHKVQSFAWLEKVFFKYFLVIKTTEYCKLHNKWRSYDKQSA